MSKKRCLFRNLKEPRQKRRALIPLTLSFYPLRNFSCFLLFLTAFVFSPACSALSATKKHLADDAPKVRPVFEQNGKFGYCLAERFFDNGRSLAFALSPYGKINLGIMIPNAGFSSGGHYDLLISLTKASDASEKVYKRTVRAVAIDANSLVLQMGKNPSFEKVLVGSQRLSVAAAGNKIFFDLPPMKVLLENLERCNDQNQGKAGSPAAKSDKDLPDTLKALLAEAGFKDITPINMDDIPEDQRPADFMWKTGSLLGGVRERLIPQDKKLSELIGLYIQGLKNRCTGAFNAEIGREEMEHNLKLRVAEVRCLMKNPHNNKEMTILGALLFYLTPDHSFTIFTHETPITHKNEALAARNLLHKTIIQLAKDINK